MSFSNNLKAISAGALFAAGALAPNGAGATPFPVFPEARTGTLTLQAIPGAPTRAIYTDAPIGDPSRVFLSEQRQTGAPAADGFAANIRIFDRAAGALQETPFLTLTGLGREFEQGLLGTAFDPNFDQNGRFYVSYVATDGQHRVDEYTVSATNPNIIDPSSRRTIITIAHPDDGAPQHYAGWIGFGPDGALYITTGDSNQSLDAPGAEPFTSQNTENLLGSVLRIDPCGADCAVAGRNYNIPVGNPFTDNPDARDEIFAFGLRNPFRASFDPVSGALIVGDVGEDGAEEINDIRAGGNYGWPAFEGGEAFRPDLADLDRADVDFPLFDYAHSIFGDADTQGVSITGGGVYQGAIADADGQYFFADLNQGLVFSFEIAGDASGVDNLTQWRLDFGDMTSEVLNFITSFGFDGDGNLYVSTFFGGVFVLTGASLDAPEIPVPAAALMMIAGLVMLRRKTRLHLNKDY